MSKKAEQGKARSLPRISEVLTAVLMTVVLSDYGWLKLLNEYEGTSQFLATASSAKIELSKSICRPLKGEVP